MTKINAYLTFNGNCRDAMNFYRDCLAGELTLQTIGESPMATRLPVKMKDCILHATLVRDELTLMASDIVGASGLIKGNTVSLMLDCNSESQLNLYYERLGAGGQRTHPIEPTFWGAMFGGLTDKFGNHWLLHYQKNPPVFIPNN